MTKYRIKEHNSNGETLYYIERKNWLGLWVLFEPIYNDLTNIDRVWYSLLDEAKRNVPGYSDTSEKVVFETKFNKL